MKSIVLIAAALGIAGLGGTASANVFASFQQGELGLQMQAGCATNNAINFKSNGRSAPCESGEMGVPGTAWIASASGDFSQGAFSSLQGSTAQLIDLAFPGVGFYSGAPISVSQGPVDVLRFDLNRSGSLDAGDVVFEARAFSFGQDESLQLKIGLSGNFREVTEVENGGTPSERIRKTPFLLPVDPAGSFLIATYPRKIESLFSIGFYGSRFNPWDPLSEIAREFDAVPIDKKVTPVFSGQLVVSSSN